MRGCEKHGLGLERFANHPLDHNALVVHIDWNGFKACSIERLACAVISRVFDEDAVTGVEQHVGT